MHLTRPIVAAQILATLACTTAFAQDGDPITVNAIETVNYLGGPLPEDQSALAVKLQVLLDRADISPGVIDGFGGGMTVSALRAFEFREQLPVDGVLDGVVWDALGGKQATGILGQHTISAEDVAEVTGPLPRDYSELAQLKLLGYSSGAEALAERFHMDEQFLRLLNPSSSFTQGDTIFVTKPRARATGRVTSILIDKPNQRLLATDAEGRIVANYPVAVGSAQTPSPSGLHEVRAIAIEPNYTYNPDNFQQGDNNEILTLPPGPNGPVGAVWIDLTEPSYGIHGTPEPASLFTAQSHGCVRMTNWDAAELANMVDPGTTVQFWDGN